MTLKLELYDSVTGDLIATASDRRESPRRGYYQWTNSVSNTADARRMLERWAKDLHKRLDEARAESD
jgi:DNA-binding HxlR family transcriptional regulator